MNRVGLVLVAFAGGGLVAFSGLHHFHNSDSLLPILVSTQHWTCFFWEQDRYGMLVPLVAAPFSHPLANLLVQTFLTAMSGIASLYLAARYLVRDESWLVAGLAAVGTLFLVTSTRFLWMYFSTWNPPAPALALAFASLNLCETASQRHLIFALILMLLATWVNAAIGPFCFVLVLTLGLRNRWKDPMHRRGLALAIAGTVASLIEQSFATFQGTTLTIPPPEELLRRLKRGPVELWQDLAPRTWVGYGLACSGGVSLMLLLRQTRSAAAKSLAVVVAVLAAGLLFAVVMALASQGYWRYHIPTLILLHVAITAACIRPLALLLNARQRRIATLLLSLGVLAAIPWSLGLRSIAGIRRDLETMPARSEGVNPPRIPYPAGSGETAGSRADAVVSGRCTHVAGGYWEMGPVVFLANVKRADAGVPGTVWGLSLRSHATAEQWRSMPSGMIRAAVFPNHREALVGLRELKMPLQMTEMFQDMQLYTSPP